jgi:hypothetical protein
MTEFNAEGKRIYLQLWYPELPPTGNHIYIMGSRLTDEARSYREKFKKHIVQTYGHLINEFVEANYRGTDPKTGGTIDVATKDPNLVFSLQLVFYMNVLTSWNDPIVPKSRRARFRFKRMDSSNRIKFVEDCFKSSVGIDDSLTFFSSQMKLHSLTEGVLLTYNVMDPQQFGVPLIYGAPA